jgi:hypothetical protein
VGDQPRGNIKHELVQYSATGEVKSIVIAEGYRESDHTEEEIESYASNPPSFMGVERMPEDMVQRYASSPRGYGISGRSKLFDERGRLWIASWRGERDRSYLDLYEEGKLLGTLEVRDRVLAFDLMGSTLAVLVERGTRDAEGLPIRGIDWYAIRD